MSSVLKVDKIQSDTGSINLASSLSGSLSFSGTGNRITGDMSNATLANRLAFQSSTTNGVTDVNVLPNGTSVLSRIRLNNNSDPTNAGILSLFVSDTVAGLESNRNNPSGTYLPMILNTGGSERMRIDTSGNVGIGTTSLLSGAKFQVKTATDKNFFIGTNSVGYLNDAGSSWVQTDVKGSTITFGTGQFAVEAARIDSSGNLLVGSTGVGGRIYGVHGDNDRAVLRADATNASFTQNVQALVASRAANSAYTFLLTFSSAGGDVEHNLRGDGNAFADGTWQNNGADYAEFFESANGQALTLGATVVLDGNKVREATEQDPASAVIGVVRPKEPSKASMIIGNTAWNKWANKYLTDDFDRYIMEDHDVVEWTDEDGKQHSYESHVIPEGITAPEDATVKTHDDKGNKFQHYKLNPAWNPDSEYVNRENRPEWNIIGLVGQVKVLKGQLTNDRWVKMRDVSATVEEWFIR